MKILFVMRNYFEKNVAVLQRFYCQGNCLTKEGWEALLLEYSSSEVQQILERVVFSQKDVWAIIQTEYGKPYVSKMSDKLPDIIGEYQFSLKKLIDNKCWSALADVGRIDLLIQMKAYKTLLERGYYSELIECGQVDLVYDKVINNPNCAHAKEALQKSHIGMQKILAEKNWGFFYDGIKFCKSNGFAKETILNILLENKQKDLLFAKCEYEYLLERGETKYFVEKEEWYLLYKYHFVSLIDWDKYWEREYHQNPQSIDWLYEAAANCGKIAFLFKHKKFILCLKAMFN